jgi:hypothetical protein
MTHILFANLDRSLKVVPAGHFSDYWLTASGLTTRNQSYWLYFRALQSYYENRFLSTVTEVFTQCINHWIRLQNEQKFELRPVSLIEFSHHANRIYFVVQFLLVSKEKFEKSPSLQNQLCDALFLLLPRHTKITFPKTLEEITPETFAKQLDPEIAWQIQELSPPPLTPHILGMPAPLKEITELPPCIEKIDDLPALYDQVMKDPQPWWSWIKLPWTTPRDPKKEALQKMCDEITRYQKKENYGMAK